MYAIDILLIKSIYLLTILLMNSLHSSFRKFSSQVIITSSTKSKVTQLLFNTFNNSTRCDPAVINVCNFLEAILPENPGILIMRSG